jgi:hypothetical protein
MKLRKLPMLGWLGVLTICAVLSSMVTFILATTVQNRWPVGIGVWAYGSPIATSVDLNLVTTQIGFSFFPCGAKTVSKVRIWQYSHAGTITDYQCDICSDAAGLPNASLSHVNINSAGFADGVIEFTGFTQAVTSHTMYWVAITNTTGTPASNHPQIVYVATLPWPSTGSTGLWGYERRTGLIGVWGSATAAAAGYEIEYSDGSIDGWLASNGGVSTIKVYDTGAAHSEYAASFTTRPNTGLQVRGIAWMSRKVLAPSSGLKFAIYQTAHTALATTATIPAANISTSGGYNYAYFSSTLTLSANTTYKVSMIYDGTDGDTSNYYQGYQFTIANLAATKALGPMGGTVSRTYWNGTAWDTLLDTEIPVFVLLLDTDGPFPTVTGGGGTGRVIPQ